MSLNPYESPRESEDDESRNTPTTSGESTWQYEITINDIVDCQAELRLGSRQQRRNARVLIVVTALIVFGLVAFVSLRHQGSKPAKVTDRNLILILGTLFGSSVIGYQIYKTTRAGNWIVRRQIRSQIRRLDLQSITGHHTLRLQPETLEIASPRTEVSHQLKFIPRLVVGRLFIYVFTDSVNAIPVPLRAFSAESDAWQFIAFLEAGTGRKAERWE